MFYLKNHPTDVPHGSYLRSLRILQTQPAQLLGVTVAATRSWYLLTQRLKLSHGVVHIIAPWLQSGPQTIAKFVNTTPISLFMVYDP